VSLVVSGAGLTTILQSKSSYDSTRKPS